MKKLTSKNSQENLRRKSNGCRNTLLSEKNQPGENSVTIYRMLWFIKRTFFEMMNLWWPQMVKMATNVPKRETPGYFLQCSGRYSTIYKVICQKCEPKSKWVSAFNYQFTGNKASKDHENSTTGVQLAKFRMWETLLPKQYGFFKKYIARQ